ncbi:MAG: oligosaccharide flippase family protein [Anaerolineales bacterium]|nr:oligosaccharide flippase family protein [Anaerolineales bacterium]
MNKIKELLRSRLASASALLMLSMTVVNAGNYIYNLIMGRWLGPSLFADLSLIVTLLLIVTFLTAPIQMTAARYAAIHTADGDGKTLASLRRFIWFAALGIGLTLTVFFALFAPALKNFFHTQSSLPFVIFGAALPFAMLQSVERGILQGRASFKILAISYQVEMWSRLLVSILLVALGLSVNGAVIGISLSFVFTWLVARSAVTGLETKKNISKEVQFELLAFAAPVLVSQLGQILINNSDVILVKRFFETSEAGKYAALALIGRIVFFATWSVVTTMFPIVAQKQKMGEPHAHLLWVSLGIVAGVSLPIVLLALFVPQWVVTVLFGEKYLGIAELLWLYALATSLYAMANVVINYRLSLGMGRETGFAIAAGIAQVLGIVSFHASLAQVVYVQVIVMAALFLALMWRNFLRERAVALLRVALRHA